MKALIIEPDKILADNYHQVLSNAGFDTLVLFDPQSAVEEMDVNLPDIIIMELQLAPLSGLAFLYEIRSYEDFGSVPVIVYSSVPKENFNLADNQWQRLGVSRYFYKSKISIQKVASYAKAKLQ